MTNEQRDSEIERLTAENKRIKEDIYKLEKWNNHSASTCDEHQWPYGADIDGDNRPRCVWCESLRADALERKVVEMSKQLDVAENLLINATPNPKFLTMGFQEKWAKEFGKWYAERKHGGGQ